MALLILLIFLLSNANAQYLQHNSDLYYGKECTVSLFIPDTSEFFELYTFNQSVTWPCIKCKKDNGYLYEFKFIPYGQWVIFTFDKMRGKPYEYIEEVDNNLSLSNNFHNLFLDQRFKFLLEIKDFIPEFSMIKLKDSVVVTLSNNDSLSEIDGSSLYCNDYLIKNNYLINDSSVDDDDDTIDLYHYVIFPSENFECEDNIRMDLSGPGIMKFEFFPGDLCDSLCTQAKFNNGRFEVKLPIKPDTIISKDDVTVFDYEFTNVGDEWICTFKLVSKKIYNRIKINNNDFCVKLPTFKKPDISAVYFNDEKYYKIKDPNIYIYTINKIDPNSGKILEYQCFEPYEKHQLFPANSYIQYYSAIGISYLIYIE